MRKQVYAQRKRRVRSAIAFLTIVSILVMLLVRMDRSIRPTLCALCESETRSFVSRLMAESTAQALEEQAYCYENFTSLVYDPTGNITAVETHTEQLSRLQSAMLFAVQQKMEDCRNATLKIPLGTASGVWLFAGHGPTIPVRLLPVGNASVKIISELEAAGINQTCHRIRVVVTADLTAAIPFSETEVSTVYDCLISETVLVGRVPDAYLEIAGDQG